MKIQHVFTSENLPFQYTPKFAEVGVKMDYFDKSGTYEYQISTGMAFKHARQHIYVLGVTLQKASVVDAVVDSLDCFPSAAAEIERD